MKKTKFAKTMRQMPPLRHSFDGVPFHWAESEVIRWMAKNPAIMSALFDAAKGVGHIRFNAAAGVWKGADYVAPQADGTTPCA